MGRLENLPAEQFSALSQWHSKQSEHRSTAYEMLKGQSGSPEITAILIGARIIGLESDNVLS